MSGSLIAAALAVGSTVGSILLRQGRAIGTIIPGIIIEEIGSDDLVITEHPVEQGAAITDHSYKRPAELRMHCAWGSSAFDDLTSLSDLSGAFAGGYARQVYASLLALQNTRRPFTLVTGKRTYPNMLIASLTQLTDRNSETTLDVQAVFREVLITRVKTESASADVQTDPRETADVQDSGVRQPVDTSITAGDIEGPQRSLSVIRKLDEIRGASGSSVLVN